MTALAQERLTPFAGRQPSRGSYGIKANVQIWKGSLICLDSAGRAMPGGTIASGALFAVGKASASYNNLTTSPTLSGAADACQVEVEFGDFGWVNSGAGVDAIAAADVGKTAYVVDDQTVSLTSNGGLRPVAGVITEFRASVPYVLSSPDAAGFLREDVAATPTTAFLARNLVTSAVTLATYTVAANQGVNDDILNVEGDIVLLLAQATASANGLYSVGAVGGGTAALTRIPTLFTGRVIDENSINVFIAEGAKFAGGTFANTAAGTIGTDNPVFRNRLAPVVQLKSFRVRNVVNGDVPDLAAFVVASDAALTDTTLNVENDLVLLVRQTTAAQNGVYVVGTVAGGLAPLTRLASMPSGYVFLADEFEIAVASGAIFGHTRWFNAAAGTIATDSPQFFPESVTQSIAFPVNTGLSVITNVPILSATKTMLSATVIAFVTGSLTVQYSRQPSTVVASPVIGTASITLMAAIAAGTVNVDDDSTMLVTITNR